jgi:hypothetical protein
VSSVAEYRYRHVPTIARFSDAATQYFVRGLMGPFGSGKSAGCVIELIKLAQMQRPGPDGKRRARFAIIRNTYPQLKDTTIRTVEQWIPFGVFGTYTSSDHKLVVDQLAPDLEIEFLFRALDQPKHVSNLLSLELTGAWVNEAREVPWTIIQALTGRVGRYPSVVQGGCVNPCIIMDTNPPDDESWWYRVFEEQRPEGWQLFRQPGGRTKSAENIPHLPEHYYERMAAGADPDFVKVYVDAEYGYVKEGKPVFPTYLDSIHCTDSIEVNQSKHDAIFFGWDFGLMPAWVACQITPRGRLHVFDELTADSLGIDAFGDAVAEHLALKWPEIDLRKVIGVGDPSGNSTSSLAKENETSFTILRSKGFVMFDGVQVIETRLGSVRHALNTLVDGVPKLAVHPRAKMIRKGFQGRYQYRKLQIAGTDERFHDAPDKNDYSHPHDALQYVCARLFGNIIKGKDAANRRAPIKYPSLGIV